MKHGHTDPLVMAGRLQPLARRSVILLPSRITLDLSWKFGRPYISPEKATLDRAYLSLCAPALPHTLAWPYRIRDLGM